jgi:ankyrin repeat protein
LYIFRNIVELLLKLQASANIPDQKGCYPLHLAAWRGNEEICRVLITHGPSTAKVNAQVMLWDVNEIYIMLLDRKEFSKH